MKILILNIGLLLSLIAGAQTYNLDYYFDKAKTNSPLINKAKNDNKLIQLDIQSVKNILNKPIVNIEGNLLFAPIISHDKGNKIQFVSDGANSYTGYDLAYSDGGQYQAFVTIKQPLFLGGSYKAYSQKADISTQLNENSIKLTNHELEQLVSYQYILCLKAKQQSEISQYLLSELNKQLELMQKLVENAIYKQSDLILMQIETVNYRIEYQKYISEYKNNLADLNLLCGIYDTNLVEIQAVDFKLKPDTITQSQFLTKYKLDSINIETEKLIFNQKYKPQVNLFANAGLNAIYTPTLNRFGFAAGLNFSWNIFDGHQKKIQEDKSLIKMQTIKFEKQNFINQHETNKNKYLSQIKDIKERINLVQKQLVDYKQLVNLYQLQFSQGQISVMDFKNLVRDISSKKQEKLLLKMQEQLLINSLNYWNY